MSELRNIDVTCDNLCGARATRALYDERVLVGRYCATCGKIKKREWDRRNKAVHEDGSVGKTRISA